MSDKTWSRSAIDRLGDRLRDDDPLSPETFDQLQEYFSTLEPFAAAAFAKAKEIAAGLEPVLETDQPAITRRQLKTLTSTREKLRRQTTKLSQMQDLVGCRIVVGSLSQQNELTDRITRGYTNAISIHDRRADPVNGYRAIHAIVRDGHNRFEIQIRTKGQDAWANIVESIADKLGIDVKYGGGPAGLQGFLKAKSDEFCSFDEATDKAKNAIRSGHFDYARLAIDEAEAVLDRISSSAISLGDYK